MAEDDGALVRAYLGGDRSAFTVLVERHRRRVYNLAARMVGPSAADDVCQDVFLTCLRKLPGYRGDAAFTTWLHRVAVNASLDHLRKGRREVAAEETPDRPAPDRTDEVADRADVQRALLSVPAEFRAPLVMHDVMDLPYEEIAEALGAPLGTVKSRIHRGRVALGRAMRGELSEVSPPSKETT